MTSYFARSQSIEFFSLEGFEVKVSSEQTRNLMWLKKHKISECALITKGTLYNIFPQCIKSMLLCKQDHSQHIGHLHDVNILVSVKVYL